MLATFDMRTAVKFYHNSKDILADMRTYGGVLQAHCVW